MIELTVISGPDKGMKKSFDTETIGVGRDPRNALVLSDERVAARHGEIVQSDTLYVYVDLESPLGTTVKQGTLILRLEKGGRRNALLSTGSCIGVGSSVIEVNIPKGSRQRTAHPAALPGQLDTKAKAEAEESLGIEIDTQEFIAWSGNLQSWGGQAGPLIVRTLIPVSPSELAASSSPKVDDRAPIFGEARPPSEARIRGSWVELQTKGTPPGLQPRVKRATGEGHEPTSHLFRRRETQLDALLGLCDELLGHDSFNPMVMCSLQAALAIFPKATCSGLFLCTADGVSPWALRFADGDAELPAGLAFSRGLVEMVAARAVSVRYPQGSVHAHLDPQFLKGPIQSSILVPLRGPSGPMGIFGLASKGDDHAFSKRDILRCEALAGFLATGLLRARGNDTRHQALEPALRLAAQTAELSEPARAGHAERVAASAATLARAAHAATQGRLASVQFGASAIERIRCVALLQGLWRPGVDASLLKKRSRLDAADDLAIRARFDQIIYRFAARAQDTLLRALAQQCRAPSAADLAGLAQEHDALRAYLEQTMAYIRFLAHKPVLTEGDRAKLIELHSMEIRLGEGESYCLIDARELETLSLPSGFISAREAKTIADNRQRGVSRLEQIPWPAELQGVPALVARYHQALLGVHGSAERRDPETGILCIASRFDELMMHGAPPAMALATLRQHAAAGHLDPDLVALFARLVAERSGAPPDAFA